MPSPRCCSHAGIMSMWRVCNSQLSEDSDVRVKQCTVDMKKRAWSVGRWSQDFSSQARVTQASNPASHCFNVVRAIRIRLQFGLSAVIHQGKR